MRVYNLIMTKTKENKVQALRLVQLDEMIRSGTYPSMKKIMDTFEISRATVNRDIDFLRDRYDAPVCYDSIHNGYYYSDPTFFIKSVMLSEGELFSISTIMPLLEQYKNTPLESSFKNVLSKIAGMLPSQVQIDSGFLSSDVQFISDPLPEISEQVFYDIFQAIKLKKSISFDYRSISSTQYTSRTVDPYKVICQKGNWYVAVYCHKHQDFRIYNLSRIKNLTMGEAFSYNKNYEKELHIDDSFGVWNNKFEPQKIELVFDSSINTMILEKTWHKDQECHQNEDGTVYLSFNSNQIQETLYWVLHFGSAVTVLNPPELKTLVEEEIKKLSSKYKL